MNSSTLLQVYAALDSMSVTFTDAAGGSTTARCYTLNELPGSVKTAQLPCRLLLPIGQGEGGSPNLTIEPGGLVNAQWVISDLFLLEAMGQGGGIHVQAPVLMSYVVAYANAIKRKWINQYQWQNESFTISVVVTPGIFNYPQESDANYYGVKCDLTVTEIF